MGDTSTMNSGMRGGQSAFYGRNSFSHSSTSPPNSAYRSDVFRNGASRAGGPGYAASPSDRSGATPLLSTSLSDPTTFGQDNRPASAIIIRRLSRSTSRETLASMLLFAGDLIDTEFIRSPYPEDQGFATAVARFQSQAGAVEAQQKLNGKPNTAKETNMVVELHSSGMNGAYERRNTIDGTSSRTQTSSASSAGSASGPAGRSRYGNSFQSPDKVSPPLPTSSSGGSGDFPVPESSARFQNLFSPQSPLANGIDGRNGKHMINADAVDEETGELLKDPVAYANSGPQQARRGTNSQLPLNRFASLSLSTNNENGTITSPPPISLTSPRNAQSMQSPMSPGMGPNSSYQMNFPRPQYPPVNPADQNPPCNTLYVGNLPIDTSEDELKAIFSKQRGYKRLCFRTKQNGPMCFVEFEDVSFATKALNELYGHPLSNSIKGGIRLSFSKNPLGVRSGQPGPNGMGAQPVMNPHAMAPGYGMNVGAPSFSAVSGPPPGLGSGASMMSAPQFRPPPPPQMGNGMDGMFANPFGMPSHEFEAQMGLRSMAGNFAPQGMNGPAYDRDGRQGYSSYSMGR
ncbi:cell cycle RNA binding protein whi3 [Saxophila tyrrhenica]|uniref:Cell cycle RNA binding protein whi3 n=1 Tax=Saxophila tyrrhenica TaxID=1690608 RepID=A0AAV9PAZ5_9PEZI|nr:cell cycle RNA binding protein whi3 [Saxophila tyrrhenica]